MIQEENRRVVNRTVKHRSNVGTFGIFTIEGHLFQLGIGGHHIILTSRSFQNDRLQFIGQCFRDDKALTGTQLYGLL